MEDKKIVVLLEEIVALLTIQVKRGVLQSVLIKEMGEIGLQPKRISELVGTTPNTVRVALHQIKKKNKSKK